jgi:hypothetical protein
MPATPEPRQGAPIALPHRLAELGLHLSYPVEDDTSTPPRTYLCTAEDPDALVRDLEASGRFRRDTRLGSLYHRGEISLREVSPTDSLHITMGREKRSRPTSTATPPWPITSGSRAAGTRCTASPCTTWPAWPATSPASYPAGRGTRRRVSGRPGPGAGRARRRGPWPPWLATSLASSPVGVASAPAGPSATEI